MWRTQHENSVRSHNAVPISKVKIVWKESIVPWPTDCVHKKAFFSPLFLRQGVYYLHWGVQRLFFLYFKSFCLIIKKKTKWNYEEFKDSVWRLGVKQVVQSDDKAFKRFSDGCVKLSPHNLRRCLLSNPLTRVINRDAKLSLLPPFKSTPDILVSPKLWRGKKKNFLLPQDFGQWHFLQAPVLSSPRNYALINSNSSNKSHHAFKIINYILTRAKVAVRSRETHSAVDFLPIKRVEKMKTHYFKGDFKTLLMKFSAAVKTGKVQMKPGRRGVWKRRTQSVPRCIRLYNSLLYY